VKLEVTPAEALVVGPDEVLVLLMSADSFAPVDDPLGDVYDPLADLTEYLKAVGLENRVLIVFGEAQLAKVSLPEVTA
jgi:hypothetical protein